MEEVISIAYIIIDFIRIFGVLCTTFYIFIRAINIKIKSLEKAFIFIWCALSGILYAVIASNVPSHIILLILNAFSIFIIYILKRIKLKLIIPAFLISFAIGYILYTLSALLVTIAFWLIFERTPVANLSSYLILLSVFIAIVFQLLLASAIFKIRRYKNGFPFLMNKHMLIFSLLAYGLIVISVTLISNNFSAVAVAAVLIIIGIGIGITIWIRRGIVMFYKKKIEEHNCEILEKQLLEKEEQLKKLTEENMLLSAESHKINKRLAALEQMITVLSLDFVNCNADMERKEEFKEIIRELKRLGNEYRNDLNRNSIKRALPTTNIKMLDGILDYFQDKCINNNIQFNLMVKGSIPYLVEKIIDQGKLETLIGDHIQNAIIAVNASNSLFRSILVSLGLAGDCYEFTIYDSGIEFDIDTLLLLGTERTTTHRDTGGSGIGFMTTFDTLNICAGSLIIEEKIPSSNDYTKAVSIRFDGQNQYVIKTYRQDRFPTGFHRNMVVTRDENL